MADVAKLAGVSTATVSHVVSGNYFVSEETSKRVNKAIEQLGYTPNLMARNLKTGKSNAVLFVVPDVGNSFFSTAIQEIEAVLTKRGYRLLVANTSENIHLESAHLKGINNSVVDGILLASTAESWSVVKQLLPRDMPIVLLDRTFTGCDLCSITIDCAPQLRQAVEALAKKGHSRIGFIGGYPRLSTTKLRKDAYCNAMAGCGLEVEPGFIQEGDTDYLKVEKCCDNLLAQKCTAVIAANGAMSYFARHVFILRGKKLGDDMELIGFVDAPNTDLMLDYFASVRLPINEMARKAGEQLVAQIKDGSFSGEALQLPATLTFRDEDDVK